MFIQASRFFVAHLQTHTFSALARHRDFRRYWLASITSSTGFWIQMTAQGWLVYELTGSALYLGTVAFAMSIPYLFLTPVGGVLADRFERRHLMLGSQVATM